MGYVQALAREGIDAAIVGDVTEPSDGRVLVDGTARAAAGAPRSGSVLGCVRRLGLGGRGRRVGSPRVDLIAVGDVMVDVHVQAPALKRGGDVHGRVRLQPAGTSANAAVWAASDGADVRVHGSGRRRPDGTAPPRARSWSVGSMRR